jgi:3-oxoacyl-[acyl-carrier protein] reductase
MKAVITGATKGIGKAIALAMARQGFNLGLTARSEIDLAGLEKEIKEINPYTTIISKASNVADKNELRAFAAIVSEKWTSIDALVLNAGLFTPGLIADESEEAFEQMISTNIVSAYHLTRAFVKGMIAQKKGHIFIICSSASTHPKLGAGSYSVTKYALKGFADNLREELKEHHIKVTSIMPGSTFTSSWDGTTIPQEQFIQSEDIANAVVSAYNMSKSAMVEEIYINPTTNV